MMDIKVKDIVEYKTEKGNKEGTVLKVYSIVDDKNKENIGKKLLLILPHGEYKEIKIWVEDVVRINNPLVKYVSYVTFKDQKFYIGDNVHIRYYNLNECMDDTSDKITDINKNGIKLDDYYTIGLDKIRDIKLLNV